MDGRRRGGRPGAGAGMPRSGGESARRTGRGSHASGASSCQATTVDGITATRPAGSVSTIVSSSSVQALPNAPASRRRAASRSRPTDGSTSCGTKETASPLTTTFPRGEPGCVGGQRGPSQPAADEHHPTGGFHHCRTDHDGCAVDEPGVGQRDLVHGYLARRLPCWRRCDQRCRHPGAGQGDRVPRTQAERVEHLRMQPDDAATGVDGRRGEPRDKGDARAPARRHAIRGGRRTRITVTPLPSARQAGPSARRTRSRATARCQVSGSHATTYDRPRARPPQRHQGRHRAPAPGQHRSQPPPRPVQLRAGVSAAPERTEHQHRTARRGRAVGARPGRVDRRGGCPPTGRRGIGARPTRSRRVRRNAATTSR